MAVTKIQAPQQIAPSSNYMWCTAKPNSIYSGSSDYYVQYQIFNALTNARIFTNNTKVYATIWNGYSVFDIHKVLENYNSYSIMPLTGTTGYYTTTNSLYKYFVDVYEMSATTQLSQYQKFMSGYTFQGGINSDNTQYDFNNYMIGNSSSKLMTNWVGDHIVRSNDRGVISWLEVSGLTGFLTDSHVSSLAVDVTDSNGVVHQYSYPIGNTTTVGYGNFGIGPWELNQTVMHTGHTLAFTGATVTNILTSNNAISYSAYSISIEYIVPFGYVIKRSSEFATYLINYECNNIQDIQLMWLNKLGSWDSYTFYKEFHKTLNIAKSDYKTNDYNLINGTIQSPSYLRGETVLNLDVQEKYTVKSKILSNQMFSNVGQLFESPEVYWVNGTTVIPVIIDSTEQEVFNNYNRGVRPFYEFSFVKANKNVNLSN